MGFYLLNISVDPADSTPNHVPEDLSINDQESIVEIVLEKIFGYENAIKEYDDHDTEDHTTKKSNIKVDLTAQYIIESNLDQPFTETIIQKFPNYTANLTTGFQKLDIPPPKI